MSEWWPAVNYRLLLENECLLSLGIRGEIAAIYLIVTITRHNYIFRPSMLALFRLYMRNLSISYTNVCGEFRVCGVGWVRDLVLCWTSKLLVPVNVHGTVSALRVGRFGI